MKLFVVAGFLGGGIAGGFSAQYALRLFTSL